MRYSLKANMESEVSAKLKVGVNTNFSHIVNDVVSNEAFYNAVTISPLMSIYDSLGNPSANIDPSSGNLLFNNPVTLTRTPVHNVDDRFLGNIFGEYRIIPGLTFRSAALVWMYIKTSASNIIRVPPAQASRKKG